MRGLIVEQENAGSGGEVQSSEWVIMRPHRVGCQGRRDNCLYGWMGAVSQVVQVKSQPVGRAVAPDTAVGDQEGPTGQERAVDGRGR